MKQTLILVLVTLLIGAVQAYYERMKEKRGQQQTPVKPVLSRTSAYATRKPSATNGNVSVSRPGVTLSGLYDTSDSITGDVSASPSSTLTTAPSPSPKPSSAPPPSSEGDVPPTSSPLTRDELKRAVIWGEILQRKF